MGHRLAIAALIGAVLLAASPARAQIWYDGTGNRWDAYNGTVTPNPTFAPPDYSAPQFSVPSLPQVPDVSQGVGQGGGPWGTAIPSGPSSYPCTMPGCD